VRLLTRRLTHSAPIRAYIRAYSSGVRENGGQLHTTAAAGAGLAFAALGDGDSAYRVFDSHQTRYGAPRPVKKPRSTKAEPKRYLLVMFRAPPPHGRGGWTLVTGGCSVDMELGGGGASRACGLSTVNSTSDRVLPPKLGAGRSDPVIGQGDGCTCRSKTRAGLPTEP